MNHTNHVALITGGRRMGLAVAEALAERGIHVALSYAHSRESAEEAAQAVRSAGRQAAAIRADLTSPEGCRALVGQVVSRLGGIDVLINMASVYVEKPFHEITLRDWSAALDIDLRAAFLCAQAAAPIMRARGGGRIINFSDWTARSGRPRYKGFLPYYVAKTGVIGLTEALALELAADNILVNALAPGPILPPAGASEEERRAVEAVTPLKRWGGEAEIAGAIVSLLDADFITGETIRVDGGRHIR